MTPPSPTRSAPALNPDAIAGTWTCVSAIIDGRPLPEEVTKRLRLTLTKESYRTTKGDQVLFESTYKLDPSRSPCQINIIGTEGDLAGKEAQGICALSDDLFKICYTMPGRPRPAQFESPAGSQAQLIVWKRTKG